MMTPFQPTPNPWLLKLVQAANKPQRLVLGLMSGTSLDGLDLALCTIEGAGQQTKLRLLYGHTQPYPSAVRQRIESLAFRPRVSLRKLTVLHAWLARIHADIVLECLGQWGFSPTDIDCLASHGQTLYHAPLSWGKNNTQSASLQGVDGDHLAHYTGMLTLADFRQQPLAAGGQGAPLAPYAESLLYQGEVARILLNLGGVANYTWLSSRFHPMPLRCADSGPANALLDRAVKRLFPQHPKGYDEGGRLALGGKVHPTWLQSMLKHPYFNQQGSKSTGPEVFGDAFLQKSLDQAEVFGLTGEDIMASLTALSAKSVAHALLQHQVVQKGTEIYASGGGAYNPALMGALQVELPQLVWCKASQLGISIGFKEAMLFAVLAHETLWGAGFEISAVHSTATQDKTAKNASTPRKLWMGKLCFP